MCAVYGKMTNQCVEQVEMDAYMIKKRPQISVCLFVCHFTIEIASLFEIDGLIEFIVFYLI